MDPVLLARYPFLPQARPWFEEVALGEGIDIEMLLSSPMMESARQRGKLRLVEMITHKDGVDMQTFSDIHDPEGQIAEAFSFIFARMVVCAAGDKVLISRWSQAEAELAAKRLCQEGQALEDIARTYVSRLEHQAGSQSAKDMTWDGTGDLRALAHGRGVWRLGLADYVELCPRITGARWRLSNHDVEDGWVTLRDERNYCSDAQLSRLLRERIKDQIEQEAQHLMDSMQDEIIAGLDEYVAMLTGLSASQNQQRMELSMVDQADWPPCMHKAVTDLDHGVNVNHSGRLFLASFAAKIELPQEECTAMFRNAPDYNPETTSYQVSQIYSVGYTPSGCEKLKLGANCPVQPGDDRLCDQEWMTHPLKYLRAKQRRRGGSESSGHPENTED